jgi:uncharacterized repeat protein (TIGR03803 family)
MRLAKVLALCLLPSIAAAQTVQPVQILHEFPTPVARPDGPLLQVPDGSFYGVTSNALYRVATNGDVTIAARFDDGVGASGALVRTPDAMIFGTTQWGGAGGAGTVYRFDPATGAVTTLHAFGAAAEGITPQGGLTLAGGLLYGVTTSTLFRVDPATGGTTILYTFGVDAGQIYGPTSPPTLASDGFLYGTTRSGPGLTGLGAIYRFDPATSAVTVVHTFTDLLSPEGRLLLGLDGRLYGSAGGPGASGVGGLFRYAPATDTYEVIFAFPASTTVLGPGPLAMTADGALYGTTVGSTNVEPNLLTTVFRLTPSGSGFTYQALRTFSLFETGLADRAQLTVGVDGLLYGYAQEGGTFYNGTLYRFDPAGGGPMANPFAFTVIHHFPSPAAWAPSEPAVPALSTHLFGTTSRPRRGAVYDIDPTTGVVVIGATIPEAHKFLRPDSRAVNSPLVFGPNSTFFGTTSVTPDSGAPGGGPDTAIIQFSPFSSVMRWQNAQVPLSTTFYTDSPMVHVPADDFVSGDLYFVRDRTVYRYHHNTQTLTSAGTGPAPNPTGTSRATRLVRATDGQVYVGISTTDQFSLSPQTYVTTARIFRINRASDSLDLVINLGTAFALSTIAAAPNGGLYLGASSGTTTGGSEFHVLDPATGTHGSVCYSTEPGLQHMTPIANGTIVGVASAPSGQKLLICNPATRAVEVRVLPATVGPLVGPLVEASGALYGATFEPTAFRSAGVAYPAARQPGGALIRLSTSGAPPALDSESDGLPNLWETAYGLDPFDATGGNGAAGDPDGDGRTNAQELADGTHPRGVLTRYFAEGATGSFFRTRFDIGNPNGGQPASVLLRFLTDTGQRILHDVVVPPGDHVAVDPSTIAGLANATFSTVVEADTVVAVDRTMSWDPSGYGSHLETGVVAPATTWYLAEGSTSGPFALFYLLQNPQAAPVDATVRYLRPFGLPPIEKVYTLAPFSRRTIVVDGEGAELASTDLSAVITAPSPIVAERAMYYSQANQVFAAGHESAGVTAPALEWFLAEGATGTFFDLFVLIANPNPTASTVEVEYLLVGGGTLSKTYTVAGNSRSTIWVDDEQLPAGSGQRPLANAALSMVVRSTNAVPIVVERTMWWPGPESTPDFWAEAHNSPGSTAAATRWLVAGAEVAGPNDAQTYVLIANPGATAGQVRVSILSSGSTAIVPAWTVTVPAKSRTNVPFTNPGLAAGTFSILVESLGTHPVPIVVEHATYSSPSGAIWASGGNALAAPLP